MTNTQRQSTDVHQLPFRGRPARLQPPTPAVRPSRQRRDALALSIQEQIWSALTDQPQQLYRGGA